MPAYAEKGENLAEMVHENLGELTPAIFRDLRKTPLSALAARSNRSFPRRGIFRGTPLSKCRGFTFPAGALSRKLGALAQKRGFACARIILMYPKFYILHSTFYIQKEILRRAFYRAPENRSAARFLGKRSGRRNGQGGKQSAPPAMAPWRDELRMTGACSSGTKGR